MKRLIKILPLFLLIAFLPQKIAGNCINICQISQQDTSSLNSKINVDYFPLPVIPPSAGIQFFRDKILFLSLTKNEKKMSPDHISFGTVEAYYASILDSVTGKHYLFSPLSAFSLPCEAVSFNPAFDTIYFTSLVDNKEKIFVAKYTMGNNAAASVTGEIKTMDFCAGNYTYSHPALSADGNTMIFASDREGTMGGMDLFITRRFRNIWSKPDNLGELNTAGNEFFPFLDSYNNLFYSSDGLKGSGGYDIFLSKYNGKGWNKPVTLPEGINSGYDDIAFTLNSFDKKTAFFTRRSGKNDLQLFKITGKRNYSDLVAVFNGSSGSVAISAAVQVSEKLKPENIETIPSPEKPVEKVVEREAEKKPAPVKSIPKEIAKPQTITNRADSAITIRLTSPLSASQANAVIYRVQIMSANTPKKEKEIMLNGKSYKLFEYFYKGSYRYCIGEFSTAKPTAELRNLARTGYPQAFLVVFRNNKRALNANAFK